MGEDSSLLGSGEVRDEWAMAGGGHGCYKECRGYKCVIRFGVGAGMG